MFTLRCRCPSLPRPSLACPQGDRFIEDVFVRKVPGVEIGQRITTTPSGPMVLIALQDSRYPCARVEEQAVHWVGSCCGSSVQVLVVVLGGIRRCAASPALQQQRIEQLQP